MTAAAVCGVKLTHDGAVAVVDGGTLQFCIEVEKVGNRPRYSDLSDLGLLDACLAEEGRSLDELDAVAVDGWARFSDGAAAVDVVRDGEAGEVPVAGYDERRDPRAAGDPLFAATGALPGRRGGVAYRSYPHATGHLFSAYCTSPYAPAGRPSLGLVWDGGMPASLYLVEPERSRVRGLGVVLDITGALYPTFAACLPPFELPERSHAEAYLPVSGKAMAYSGLGRVDPAALDECARLFAAYGGRLHRSAGARWSREIIPVLRAKGYSDADMIACLQTFLCELLVDALRHRLDELGLDEGLPLCFAGGCALNIKWNAALRASGLFSDVWVPPFPNDSGSAIGAACAQMVAGGGPWALSWSVFSGPRLRPGQAPPGWRAEPAGIDEVARILHTSGEPVVVLAGRAELGPRALGHRSIVAPAAEPAMRDRLNAAKRREWYRPIAPVCLADSAATVFEPGGRDPYMLFDHAVRPQWRDVIPAVVHVDGSARLQTADAAGNPLMTALLRAYHEYSGVPVLCNTSANLPGRGFFPDAASAMRWGGTRFVWSDGTLYRRDDAPTPAPGEPGGSADRASGVVGAGEHR